MADDADSAPKKMMRPNDLFTASYYGDLKKVKELLHIEPVEDDPPFDEDFDPLAPVDEEAEEAAKDRAARRKANADELARRLAQTGRIVTRLSPVHVKHYGFGVLVTEKNMECAVKFKPSAKSQAVATALHWAVLGREHEIVKYLLEMGADVQAEVPEYGVAAREIAEKNKLRETEKAITEGVELHAAKSSAERAKREAFDNEVARRAKLRDEAQAEVRRKEEEERLAAEAEEAAQRAAEEAEAAEAAAAEAEAAEE